ncbi:MAG TPA: FkbM family methyltransferase [Cyclobacteriaceae bacterium]|nr:FkbM family methyltransferase [Cyclobacteriaceae bacterium]
MSEQSLRHKAKLKYKTFIFNLCANRNPVYIAFYKYLYKPKKGTLAYMLDKYSRNTANLTVIQIGANDGFNHDPIVKFIKRDNWNGVLLEPQPYVFDTYLKKLHQKSDQIHTLNAALNYEDGIRSMYNIAFSKSRWATGLSSFDKAVLYDAIDSGHVALRAKKEGILLPEKREDYIEEVQIACISPATLLKQYKIEKIDLLQIDAEGFDYEIIKMMNIAESKPGMIVFEDSHLNAEQLAECHNLLIANDYEIRKTSGNAVAIKKALLPKIDA